MYSNIFGNSWGKAPVLDANFIMYIVRLGYYELRIDVTINLLTFKLSIYEYE